MGTLGERVEKAYGRTIKAGSALNHRGVRTWLSFSFGSCWYA